MKAIDGKIKAWYKEDGGSPENWVRFDGNVNKIRKTEGYPIRSFRQLIDEVALVTVNNRQYEMFYRGQAADYLDRKTQTTIYPSICRPEKAPDGSYKYSVRRKTIEERYNKLYKLLSAFRVSKSKPLEYYFAIFQHYGITPTPFIDITQSLRVAATFALRDSPTGYLYIFGLPYPNQSISHYYDHGIVLVKLQNICPPDALRPRYQEGFLVGKFPYNGIKESDDNLARRLIAKYKLDNTDNTFWDSCFLPMPDDVLFPQNDMAETELRERVDNILKTI